ncbi:unnamed protein product [Closterium sp. NIES-54]
MLVLVDNHNRYSTVFFLHTKDQVLAVVINWAEQCRNHFKRPIGRLHSDGGGEFINNTLATFCKFHGIQQTSTLPHSPQQNGIVESCIREITKIARCLIAHASTPPSLSTYALLHAALLLNLRSHPQHPSSSPTEFWSKAKPDAVGLCVWGCKSFVFIPPVDCSHAAGKLAHVPWSAIDVVFNESIPYYSTPPDPLPHGSTLSSHLSSLLLLSSPRLPLHSLRPPLLTSMTPLHPPPRPTQLCPLPTLPPPLTLPLHCNGQASSSSSSSRVISRDSSSSSSSSSSRFCSRGSSSSSSGSRVSSRGSSSSSRVSSNSSSSQISSRGSSSTTRGSSSSSSSSSTSTSSTSSGSSTEQLPAPPLSSSLACTLAPWTKSLEPLLPPPFSSLRTPMRSSSTFGTTLLSLPPSSLTSLAFPSLASPPSPPSSLPPPFKRPSPALMRTSG